MKDKDKEWNISEMLVFMLQKVDGDPFAALIELCKPVIYNSIENRYIRGFDRDDFFQEAKEVLVKAVSTYRFDTDLRFIQYFNVCLENHLNMLVRKETAFKRKSSKEASSLDELREKAGYEINYGQRYEMTPELKIIARETMNEGVVALSDFEKRAFFHYLTNLSYDDIAKQLDCDREKVQNAIYRCGMKFRSLVNKKQA